MNTPNPDFRGADDIDPILPSNIADLCGWNDGESKDAGELINKEVRTLAAVEEEMPDRFQTQFAREFNPDMLALWNDFQLSKGRQAGSADWSLIDEFFHAQRDGDRLVAGEPIVWLPQIIGSCVASNTFRPWVTRMMIQIIMFGDSMEYLGRNEYSSANFSFYAPWSYGHGRRKGNMRRGDGSYCGVQTWSLMQGVLPCNTPKLLQILQSKGLANDRDFPEPQGNDGAAFYRQMGNWAYLDELEPYIDYPMAESPTVKTADQLWDLLQAGKPCFVCSMEAIHKIGSHPDGFAIHARNPRDRWAHNMSVQGCFVASDGERFIRWSNESWGKDHLYNRRFDEVDRALRSGELTMQSIGQIDGPSSAPPSLV